jgi:hypothetical protein
MMWYMAALLITVAIFVGATLGLALMGTLMYVLVEWLRERRRRPRGAWEP